MGVLFLIPRVNSWGAAEFKDIPQLTVRGEASIFKPADQMEVSLGVVTEADTSLEALDQNNQHMHEVIAHLQALGLDETDYQTGRFHIRPVYPKPLKAHEEEESVKIHHYEVVNTIQIKTQKISLIDKIIGAAVKGGANQVDRINFNLSNPQPYRAEAIKVAAQNALTDASELASVMGVKLKRIISLSLDHWQQFPAPLMIFKEGEAGGRHSERRGEDALQQGEAEIHATVNVIFEIQ